MNSLIGKKIDGRYQLLELIGAGGMANVYRAVDVTDGKIVAVKVLREEFSGNAEFLRRFKNESRAISLLSHPGIIKVFDVSFDQRTPSIVMEYVDGITLKEYIEQRGVLGWKEALHFTVQILQALQHAHDRGIVHRDIKPQNVMLLEDGTIKIADFGIARFARSETHTITDRAIGSVHYISPEQASGEQTDARTDLYAVGVMLFEMLTGQLPFDADSPVTVALKQIQSKAVRPTSLNPEIPAGLEEITLRAMEKSIDRRYQSAAEMLRDIAAFKKDPSIHFSYQYFGETEPGEELQMKRTVREVKNKQASQKPGAKKMPGHRPPEEDPKKASRRGGSALLPVLAGVTTAFVLATLGFIGWMFYSNNPFEKVPDTVVPTLEGVAYDTVQGNPAYADFVIEIESTGYTDQVEKGIIYEQTPKAGKTVKVGSTIRVKVSEGIEQLVIPNLVDVDGQTALKQLRDMGLTVTESESYSANIAAGNVASLQPAPGTTVTRGAAVAVFISVGPDTSEAAVPHVVGMQLEDARKMLESSGFTVGGVTYLISNEPQGVVLGQNPVSETMLAGGSAVDLNVSGGSNQTTVVRLSVPLPAEKNTVKLQAMIGGAIQLEESFPPADVGVWTPGFEGTTGVYTVQILYNGQLYQTYEIDFGAASSRLVEDNSASFTVIS